MSINYTRLFEDKTLALVHGDPDYQHVIANIPRVTSGLGGGNHGHLGLILSTVEYENVLATPHLHPIHSGILIIPQGTAQHAAAIIRDNHKRECVNYHETIDLNNGN